MIIFYLTYSFFGYNAVLCPEETLEGFLDKFLSIRELHRKHGRQGLLFLNFAVFEAFALLMCSATGNFRMIGDFIILMLIFLFLDYFRN